MMPAMSTRVVSPTLAGRLAELDRLRAARDRASGGVPSTVLISGEAGVGKTRLVTEASSMARAEGFGVIVGGAIGLGDSDLPYGLFTEAFRSLLAEVGREQIIEAAGGRRRPPRPPGAWPRRRAGLPCSLPRRRGRFAPAPLRSRARRAGPPCAGTTDRARARGSALGRSVVARPADLPRGTATRRAVGPDRDVPVGRVDAAASAAAAARAPRAAAVRRAHRPFTPRP